MTTTYMYQPHIETHSRVLKCNGPLREYLECTCIALYMYIPENSLTNSELMISAGTSSLAISSGDTLDADCCLATDGEEEEFRECLSW